jgi:hypothetical protein
MNNTTVIHKQLIFFFRLVLCALTRVMTALYVWLSLDLPTESIHPRPKPADADPDSRSSRTVVAEEPSQSSSMDDGEELVGSGLGFAQIGTRLEHGMASTEKSLSVRCALTYIYTDNISCLHQMSHTLSAVSALL